LPKVLPFLPFTQSPPHLLPKVLYFSPFAQSPALFTYRGGPKAFHLSIESSILGASIVSKFLYMGQSNGAFQKKIGLVNHPQIINMKQNKYTNMRIGVSLLQHAGCNM
jgi:hypothetical protein